MAELTITIAEDAEKPGYTADCLRAINEWNDPRGVQVIVLRQGPVWDVMADLRAARPQFEAPYWIHLHNEHLFSPGTLQPALDWLRRVRPPLAMANLMRIGPWLREREHPLESQQHSERLMAAAADPAMVARILKELPLTHWVGLDTMGGRWIEDCFFASTEWIDRIHFLESADRMYFQDVYDLVAIVCKELQARRLLEDIHRCPSSQLVHRWHPKPYSFVTPETIAWFSADPARSIGTRFTPELLLEFKRYAEDPHATSELKMRFRRGPGGTVPRYAKAWRAWLDSQDYPSFRIDGKRGSRLQYPER